MNRYVYVIFFCELGNLLTGPPRYIFGRQGRHSGGHFIGEPPLPPLFSIFQNPAKRQALAALPPVADLPTYIFEFL